MNAKELSAAVADGMDFETLVDHLRPLIGKYARWSVRGFEPEDLRQEVVLVIWKCHEMYDASRGSFLNLVIRSVENRMGHLKMKAVRYYEPVSALQCRGCSVQIPRRGRGPVCLCGSTRWDTVRIAHGLLSMDDDYEGPTRTAGPLGAVDGRFGVVDDVEHVRSVLVTLGADLTSLVEKAMRGRDLTESERGVLATAFTT